MTNTNDPGEAAVPAARDCVHGLLSCGTCAWWRGHPREWWEVGARPIDPPVAEPGARCRVCGHYETSLARANEKYAHCPACGRAPHWIPVGDDDVRESVAPVAEPAQPVCRVGCGTTRPPGSDGGWHTGGTEDDGSPLFFCTEACADAGRPLNPPPVPPGPVPPEGEPKTVGRSGHDANRGLYEKFRIERTDGKSAPGEKHFECRYFVLDLDHDQYAAPALRAYASACETAFPQLAADLRLQAGAIVAHSDPSRTVPLGYPSAAPAKAPLFSPELAKASGRARANVPLSPEQLDASVAWSRQWLSTAGLSPSEYRRHYATVQLADQLAAAIADAARVRLVADHNISDLQDQLATAIRELDEQRGRAERAEAEATEWQRSHDAKAAEVEQLRAKLEEQGRGIAIVQTQAAKYGRERDEERKVNDAIAAHARAAEKEADTRVAESFRTGWADGAGAMFREAVVAVASARIATQTSSHIAPYTLGVESAMSKLAALPLPICPEGPPAPKGGE